MNQQKAAGGNGGKGGKGVRTQNPNSSLATKLAKAEKQAARAQAQAAKLQTQLAAKSKELSQAKSAKEAEVTVEGEAQPAPQPAPKMLNFQLKWVDVAWTCHACGQQHWAAGKKRCASCNLERDPQAWTLVQPGSGVPPRERTQSLPGRLANHSNFFEALGCPLEATKQAEEAPTAQMETDNPQAVNKAAVETTQAKDSLAKLAKARDTLRCLEEIGNEAAKQALLKQIKELERATKPLKEQEVTDVSNPLRVAQRATQALAEAREDRTQRETAQQRRKEVIESQITKLQEELVSHNATMQEEERDHARRLDILEKAVAAANAKATEMGLLNVPPSASSKPEDAGKQVQEFQRSLETVYPVALVDTKLKELGVTKEILDYIFKGQLATAHKMSIDAEVAKLNAQASTSAPALALGNVIQTQAEHTPLPKD